MPASNTDMADQRVAEMAGIVSALQQSSEDLAARVKDFEDTKDPQNPAINVNFATAAASSTPPKSLTLCGAGMADGPMSM